MAPSGLSIPDLIFQMKLEMQIFMCIYVPLFSVTHYCKKKNMYVMLYRVYEQGMPLGHYFATCRPELVQAGFGGEFGEVLREVQGTVAMSVR